MQFLVSKNLANTGKAQPDGDGQLALEKGLVSIIIPTYNHGRYLRDSIESALKQTYPHTEVIVVDDGSTDDTRAIVARYPVRYFFQSNQGTSAALNNGVRLSRGEFFMAVGADDMIAREYVAKTMGVMLKDKHTGLVYTGGRFFGESENAILPRKLYHRFSVLIGGRALGGEIGTIGGALTRREAFESVGGFDPKLTSYEDLDFVIRISLKGWKIKTVFELLYFPRKHGTELAHRHPDYESAEDKYARSLLDRKFWYLPLYRKLFFVYRVLFEKLFFMIQMPRAYLSAFREKYQITKRAKLYPWNNPNHEKNGTILAKLITTEIYDLLAARVAREPFLIEYHKGQLARLEALFLNLTTEDSSRRTYK